MDEIDWPDVGGLDPIAQPRLVEARVAEVEIEAAAALIPALQRMAQACSDELRVENRGPDCASRANSAADDLRSRICPNTAMLDDRLRVCTEVFEIGQAYAIDARRMPTSPAAPDQPRDIKQQRSVVT